MVDHDPDAPYASRSTPWGVIAIVLVAVLVGGFVVYELMSPPPPGVNPSFLWCKFHSGYDPCILRPPPPPSALAPVSTPDAEPSIPTIFALRHAAWQNDDFWAQLALGHLYYASRDNSSWNPVEAYVWYFLASINPQARYDGD